MGCKSECVQKYLYDDEVIKTKGRDTDTRNESEYQLQDPSNRDMVTILRMRDEALQYINIYRSQHNVLNLLLNDELNEIAQKHAEEIAETDNMIPSKAKYRGQRLGENLFSSGKEVPSKEIINQWYNDNKYYKYCDNISNEEVEGQNFTQLIWKNTRLVGLGFAKSRNGWGYCVANFYPPGNIIDQYADNVLQVETVAKSKAKAKQTNNEFSPSRSSLMSPIELSMKFSKDAFQAHNNYRALHKVPPLKMNNELCRIAQRYAEEMANQDLLQQSNNQYLDEELGESLYMCQGKQISGQEVTDTWYNEKGEYDFDKGEFNSNAGHFTQLVWKDTTDVGFGCARSTSGIYYGVGNYYPPGNYEEIFPDNVFPSDYD